MCNWERLAVAHPTKRLSPPGLHHFKLMSPNFFTILAYCLYLDFLRFPPTTESGERNELNGGAGAMCPEQLCQCFREQSFVFCYLSWNHEISLLKMCSLVSLREFACAYVLSRFTGSSRLPSCPSLSTSLLQENMVHENKVLIKLISILKIL